MSGYVPKVGDKVRMSTWGDPDAYVEVRAIGSEMFIAWYPKAGREFGYQYHQEGDGRWEPYVEPMVYPERWINVYPIGIGGCDCSSRALADRVGDNTRIGVLHLRRDGTTEMEAP